MKSLVLLIFLFIFLEFKANCTMDNDANQVNYASFASQNKTTKRHQFFYLFFLEDSDDKVEFNQRDLKFTYIGSKFYSNAYSKFKTFTFVLVPNEGSKSIKKLPLFIVYKKLLR